MKDIYEVLDELKIKYLKHEHPPVFTCEEADKHCKEFLGGKSKNLFLRNQKGDKHYLVIVESPKKVDLKRLTALLGETKISFASDKRLMKYLNLTPGAVSPLGLINDKDKEVVVIIDTDLWKHEILNFHPNTNTATLEIGRENFKKFLDWCDNEVRFFDI